MSLALDDVSSKMGSTRGAAVFGTGILTLAYLIAYCDRTIVTILIGPLKSDLKCTDSQIAALIGFSFAIFYSLAGLPLGRLTDTVNRRNLITAGLVTWTTATAACGFLNEFPQLFVARVFVGIGEACVVPTALSMIADYFGPRARAMAVATFVCGAPLGSGLAYLLGGTLLYRLGAGDLPSGLSTLTRFPWQLIFLLLGFLGFLVAVVLLFVKEPSRNRAPPTRSGLQRVATLRELLAGNKGLLAGLIGGPAIMSIAYYTFLAWGPAMTARRFAWGPQDIALWFTPFSVTSGLLGSWMGTGIGTLLIRCGRSDGLMRAAVYLAAVAGPSCVAAATVPYGGLGVALMFLSTGLLLGIITLPQVAIQYIMPNHLRGQVTALFIFCINIVGFGLGPNIVAALTDHVFHRDSSLNVSMAIVCASAVVLGGGVTLMSLSRYRAYVTATKAPNEVPILAQ